MAPFPVAEADDPRQAGADPVILRRGDSERYATLAGLADDFAFHWSSRSPAADPRRWLREALAELVRRGSGPVGQGSSPGVATTGAPQVADAAEQLLAHGQVRAHVPANGQGGSTIELRARLLRGFDGGPDRFAGAARRAGDSGDTAERLARSKAQLHSIVERIPAITYIEPCNPDDETGLNEITYIVGGDSRHEEILGTSFDQWVAEPWRTAHPDDRERAIALDRETNITGEPFVIDYRVVRRDGSIRWLHDDARLIRDDRGNALHWLGMVFDITDSKRVEEELRRSAERLQQENQVIQQERLALLGTVSAGIAHEIKNPLNFILNFAEDSLELIAEAEEALAGADTEQERADLEETLAELCAGAASIHRHARRALGVMRSMLGLSRSDRAAAEQVDVNDLVRRYAALAYHGLRGRNLDVRAEIVYDLDPALPPMIGVEAELGRVVLNLVANACEATSLSEAGSRVSEDAASVRCPTVTILTRFRDRTIEIRVRDDGIGIPANALQRIFEPFFTTKAAGAGTGLGLAISRDIVRGHGGDIEAESVPGVFTELRVRLPCRPSGERR